MLHTIKTYGDFLCILYHQLKFITYITSTINQNKGSFNAYVQQLFLLCFILSKHMDFLCIILYNHFTFITKIAIAVKQNKGTYSHRIECILFAFSTLCTEIVNILSFLLQMISYKRYLECTLVQWRLSIYPKCRQVAEVPFS